MKFSTATVVGVAALLSPYAAAVPAASSSGSSCEPKHATFDNLPRSSKPKDFYMQDLRFKNFEVVKADPKKTYYHAHNGPNMLAVEMGTKAVIKVAPNNHADPSAFFFPGHFYAGCAKVDEHSGVAKKVNCSVDFATPEHEYGGSLVTVSAFYGTNNTPKGPMLDRGEWGGPSTPYINITVYDAPKGTVFYLDNLQYSVNCIFCEKDLICS